MLKNSWMSFFRATLNESCALAGPSKVNTSNETEKVYFSDTTKNPFDNVEFSHYMYVIAQIPKLVGCVTPFTHEKKNG